MAKWKALAKEGLKLMKNMCEEPGDYLVQKALKELGLFVVLLISTDCK